MPTVSKIQRPWQSLFPNFPEQQGAGFHNSIFRGKNLGELPNENQLAAIAAGTFEDLFIGDYWLYDNYFHFRIAGFDTHLYTGDGGHRLTKHHVCVVPDEGFTGNGWNDTADTVTGGINDGAGYVNSKIRGNLENLLDTFVTNFGFDEDTILSYRARYPSAYDANGVATNYAWVDANLELMNEVMVFGYRCFGNQSGYEIGTENNQLPLFRLMPSMIYSPENNSGKLNHYWLRDVANSTEVCVVSIAGNPAKKTADNSYKLRPFFLLG